MSHVVTIKTVLKDIDAVEAVCKELGLTNWLTLGTCRANV